MKKRTLFIALTAALALAACSMPPYNERLSLAQVTVSKLGKPANEIGPVYAYLDPSVQENLFYFLPDRDDPVGGGGFLVAETSYGLRVWYLPTYSTGLEASWSIDLNNSSQAANNFLLQPIEWADTYSYLSMIRYLQNDLRVIRSTAPSDVTNPVTIPTLSTPLMLAYTVGASIFPDAAAGSDFQFFLGTDGVGVFREFAYTTSATAGIVAYSTGTIAIYGPLPVGLTNAFYVHDPDPGRNRSYLSYPSGSSYISYAWTWNHNATGVDASGFQQLAGIDGRIEAVLATGQLLAFGDGACTVYTPAGSKLYKFPLGGLKFCYEQWDPVDSRFELYFSLAYWLWGREERSDQLYVKVYSIPTTSLSSLK